MLFIVCALPCEALPLIYHFKLKKEKEGLFTIYFGEKTALIISGIGKVQAAAAVSYAYLLANEPTSAIWLNVGLAGHLDRPIGEGIVGSKIIDSASGHVFYPSFACGISFPTCTIRTVEKPEISFSEQDVYEMEASGFYRMASRVSTTELIHCYKVISDNQKERYHLLDKRKGEALIEGKMEEISKFVSALKLLQEKLDYVVEVPLEPFLQKWHFTKTQEHKLRTLLLRYGALKLDSLLDEEILELATAEKVLQQIQKKLNALPLSYVSSTLH